jgi:tRNA threonylcarbamoyladenosine biosynthesis protein TsaE
MSTPVLKTIPDEEAMLVFGDALAKAVAGGAIVYLHGQLGAGKTTLVRSMLRSMGYAGKVKSPTYTIVEPYEIGSVIVYHFDLYRLNTPDELEQIGMADYAGADAICLIEWPEKGFPLLPMPDLACYIEIKGQSRVLRLESQTARGEVILTQLA